MAVSLKSSLRSIWRVENGEGLGPFQDPVVKDVLTFGVPLSIDQRSETPPPSADPLLNQFFNAILLGGNGKDWRFGFVEQSHFDLWFNDSDMKEVLAGRGYELQEYQILDDFVHEGTNQCMFWRPAALQCFDS